MILQWFLWVYLVVNIAVPFIGWRLFRGDRE